jgi:hypothetical protein
MAAPWHNDPLLVGKFHATYPNDVQVIMHDGGPRLSTIAPELMWVRLHGLASQSRASFRVYRGTLLGDAQRLPNLKAGALVLVLTASGSPHPIRTTDAYIEDRARYDIRPCCGCGFSELFDPPMALGRRLHPEIPEGAKMANYATRCALCGGLQEVVAKEGGITIDPDLETTEPPQRWWTDWKPFS